MSTRIWWGVVIVLLIVIAVLAWFLFTTPAPLQPPTATSTPTQSATTTAPTMPLHTRVTVTSPASGTTVGNTFTVTGEAPGPWYFEAVFPIQVRDQSNNVVGHGQGQAQGDWMTDGQVPFTATITTDAPYSGPATLVILKDNESGLPQNDDSLEIPIVVQ